MCRIKPVVTLLVILISCHAIVDAVKLTFTMLGGRIYIETDPEHFAMYGQVKIKNEVTIVAVNENEHTYLTSTCQVEQVKLSRVRKSDLQDYAKIRDVSLAIKNESPAISNTENPDYTWSQTFSKDEKDFFVTRLDKNTVVYSSEYFPWYIARVIISGEVIIFVHNDGTVIMKTKNCLYPDEKNLIKGIKKINTSNGISACFSSRDDKALERHLRAHPIDRNQLSREQRYKRPLTEAELRERAERNRSIERALRGGGLSNDRPISW